VFATFLNNMLTNNLMNMYNNPLLTNLNNNNQHLPFSYPKLSNNSNNDDSITRNNNILQQANNNNNMIIDNAINTSIDKSTVEPRQSSTTKKMSSKGNFGTTQASSFVNVVNIDSFEPKQIKVIWEYRTFGKLLY